MLARNSIDVAFISFIFVFISPTAVCAKAVAMLYRMGVFWASGCRLLTIRSPEVIKRALHCILWYFWQRHGVVPQWLSVITLLNVFEISIDNSSFAFTASTKYDSHGCLDNVTTQCTRNMTLYSVWVIISQGFAANGYYLPRDKVNYGAGHVDDCSRDEVSRGEMARGFLSPQLFVAAINCRAMKCPSFSRCCLPNMRRSTKSRENFNLLYSSSRSSKVDDFGTNRKHICDFY